MENIASLPFLISLILVQQKSQDHPPNRVDRMPRRGKVGLDLPQRDRRSHGNLRKHPSVKLGKSQLLQWIEHGSKTNFLSSLIHHPENLGTSFEPDGFSKRCTAVFF